MYYLLMIDRSAPDRQTPGASAAEPLMPHLKSAGYRLARLPIEGGRGAMSQTALAETFDHRPPDLILADMTRMADMLALQHLRRLIGRVWEDNPPSCLALLNPPHLLLPDWMTYIDDFVLAPFAPAEVMGRLTQLLFRRRFISATDTLTFAGVYLDLAASRAYHSETGAALNLTPREYELLRFLLMHRGKFFDRARLLDMVWGVEFAGGERTVDIHIVRLRAKLPPSAAALLETRRNLGYGFSVPPSLPFAAPKVVSAA